jgi:2-phosphoglycerate kinase
VKRLVLIGGSTAAGKTTVAAALARDLGCSHLAVDTIWRAIREALPHGPARSDLFLEPPRNPRATAEMLFERQKRAAALISRAVVPALGHEMAIREALIVEGAWILPAAAATLTLPETVVCPVFLIEAEEGAILAAMMARQRVEAPHEWQRVGARQAHLYGGWLRIEAGRLGLPVLEARPRETLLDRVREALGA